MASDKLAMKKRRIENFIERNNGYIQIVFLIATLVIGILFNFLDWPKKEAIIINLSILLSFEIIILNIKDSISQAKLNSLMYSNDKLNGMVLAETREGYLKFPQMLSEASDDLFISGITCPGVWNHIATIEGLLEKGSHIRILISSDDALEDNVRLYQGIPKRTSNIDDYMDDVLSKINITLNTLKTNETLKKYYCKGKFELRRSHIPFSTAYVGVNVWEGNVSQKIKVTHYIEGCKSTDRCPNMILNPLDNSYWYGYYLKELKSLWDSAEPVVLTECGGRHTV